MENTIVNPVKSQILITSQEHAIRRVWFIRANSRPESINGHLVSKRGHWHVDGKCLHCGHVSGCQYGSKGGEA